MPNNNYSGTVYDIGDAIPHYVNAVYTPHVWYDQSKSYDSVNNVFEKLMISESLMLGESEDDMWTVEEILEEVLRYLNLHIVQDGYDYYIFDWETSKTSTQVVWLDIFTGDTMTKQYQAINVPLSAYAADDTQITIDDVYNQVSLTDAVEKIQDVIFSPFDGKQLINLTSPQKYMVEYAAPGKGDDASNVFYDMVKNAAPPETDYGKGSDAYKKSWWMVLRRAAYWDFMKNGVDVLNSVDVDLDGKYYNQWKLPKYLLETPFASGIVSFGAGIEYNKTNIQNRENISDYNNYICINIGGNGADEQSVNLYNNYNWVATWAYPDYPSAPFPGESDLENCGLEIKYNYSTDGVYSSADPSVTNYLVFSGKFHLSIAQQCTGSYGFHPAASYQDTELYNKITNEANKANQGGNYIDWMVFKRKNNEFAQYANWSGTDLMTSRKKTVPNSKNDDGAYYGLLFYDTDYPPAPRQNTHHENPSLVNLMPPMDRGEMGKRFKYTIDKNSYLWSSGTKYDIIPCVDILACQLSIGDMFCEEVPVEYERDGISYADKSYNWVSVDELMARGEGVGYDLLPDGTIRYKAYINLAMNIDNNQFVIGEDHDMWNNIETNMNLQDKEGIAIPLPYEKNLSGVINFIIVGPVNNSWDQGIRRHPTWFRHTQVTQNYISILPHVSQIWIKDFKVDLCSDRGGNTEFSDADIVYCSDEQKRFIDKKDDIEFRFTTALTAEEAFQMKVNLSNNKSDVVDDTGASILAITNNLTNETDKPEKIYVDAYYREYCEPRKILETTVHDGDDIVPFNKYNISFMNGDTYYFVSEEKDLRNNTTKLRLKER